MSVCLLGQQVNRERNGSSAHSVMTGLLWNVRALGKARSTFVTTVTLSQTQFTSADDPMNSLLVLFPSSHTVPKMHICFVSFADD